MDSMIKTTKMNAESIQAEVVWGDPDAAEKYAVKISPNGGIAAVVDQYGLNGGGSGRCALVNGKSLKGVGCTPFAGRGYYGTGLLPMSEALAEAKWLRVVHNQFPDAINAYAVLKINTEERALFNLSHLPDSEIAMIPEEKRSDIPAILVRDMPIRFAHFECNGKTNAENLAFCKEMYGLPEMEDYEFASLMLRRCLARKHFWFFRRLHTGSVSLDNIDIFGNVFDLPLARQLPDFRNVYCCAHRIPLWSDVYNNSHVAVAGYIANLLLPNETMEERTKAWEQTYYIAEKLNLTIFKQQSLALLGFTQEEIELASSLDPKLVDKLGQALCDYIKKGVFIPAGFNDIPEQWCGAEELYLDVPFIGENYFPQDFYNVVTGYPVGGYELDAIASIYNAVSKLLPPSTERAERCRLINMENSINEF